MAKNIESLCHGLLSFSNHKPVKNKYHEIYIIYRLRYEYNGYECTVGADEWAVFVGC